MDNGSCGTVIRPATSREPGSTAPFVGGSAEPFAEGLPAGWDGGLAAGRTRTVAGISDRDGFAIYVTELDGTTRQLRRGRDSILLGGSNSMVGGGTDLGGHERRRDARGGRAR